MKNIKFVKATRIQKFTQTYVGIVLSDSKDKCEILGVDTEKQDTINIYELEKSVFKIESEDKDRVEHHFSCAILNEQNDVNKAEIELRNVKRYLNFSQVNFKKYFNKEIERI